MLVFAHRGYHARLAENTLEAFQAAKDLGITGVETDIRADRNGVPFLFHDSRSRSGVLVSSLTINELRDEQGLYIPLLEDALSNVQGIAWNLEIKDRSALDPVVDIIRDYSDRVQIFVSSFLHDVVIQCTRQAGVDGGLLICHRPLRPESLFEGYEDSKRVSTIIWDFETIDADALSRAKEHGKSNWIYGFRSPEDQHASACEFADAIITDFPGE